jgi:hypothetical protein
VAAPRRATSDDADEEIGQKWRFPRRGCTGFDGDNKQRLHAEVRVARKTIRGELNADNYEYALAA